MNRLDFLKTGVAAGVGALLPLPRKPEELTYLLVDKQSLDLDMKPFAFKKDIEFLDKIFTSSSYGTVIVRKTRTLKLPEGVQEHLNYHQGKTSIIFITGFTPREELKRRLKNKKQKWGIDTLSIINLHPEELGVGFSGTPIK